MIQLKINNMDHKAVLTIPADYEYKEPLRKCEASAGAVLPSEELEE